MDGAATILDLKQAGAGLVAPPAVVALFREAFEAYGTRALWNWRGNIEAPTITQALAIAEALRTEGDVRARHLAVAIEQACRAAV